MKERQYKDLRALIIISIFSALVVIKLISLLIAIVWG